jgi:HK97 gp10 family phage protein
MAVKITLQVLGLKELDELFKSMPLDVQDKILKEAHKRAAKPLINQASSNAPLGDPIKRQKNGKYAKGGARAVPLKESIKAVSGGSPRRTGDLGVTRVGALRRSPYRAYHAGLVEFGTRPGGRNPGGWYAEMQRKLKAIGKTWKNGGKTVMKPNNFMGRAWDSTRDEVIDSISSFVAQRINARIKRFVRKNYIP